MILKKMRKGKCPGYEIPVELLNDGEDMVGWLQRLFSAAWKEGKVPEKWGKAVISPIYKKEEKRM